jgi:hypothetical protein
MRMIIVQSEVESFLRHLSLDNSNTIFCPPKPWAEQVPNIAGAMTWVRGKYKRI